MGYSIEATDDEIGSVQDFYFDDETWTIVWCSLCARTGLETSYELDRYFDSPAKRHAVLAG